MARVHDANVRRIAQDIAALKQDMRVVKNRKPGLAYSSIEDGAIREYDKDGVLVSQSGKQPDGTHNHVVVNGPKPPKPAGLTASTQPGLIEIRWNGRFAGGAVSPLDLKHVAAYVVPSGEFLDLSDQAGVMTGELGDNIQVQVTAGAYTVYLVAWSLAGKFSDAAGPVPVLVTAPADPVEIQGALDDLNERYDGVLDTAGQLGNRLNQAEHEITEHDQRLGKNETDITEALAGDVDVERLAIGNGVIRDLVAQHIAGQTAAFQQVDVKNLFVTTGTMTEAVINRLFAEIFTAHKVTTQMMAIGAFDNLIPEPDLSESGRGWKLDDKVTLATGAGRLSGNALRLTKVGTSSTGADSIPGAISTEEGRAYRISAWARPSVDAPAGSLRIVARVRLASGANSWPSWPSNIDVVPAGEWSKISGIVEMPKDAVSVTFYLEVHSSYPSDSAVDWDNISATRASAGELVVDGSVTAEKIAANAIKAYHADFDSFFADTGFVSQLRSKGIILVDSTGAETVNLTGEGENYININDPVTGDALVTVDEQGGVSAQTLSVVGEARIDGVLVMGGDPLHEIALGGDDPGQYGPVFNHRALLATNFRNHVNTHPSTVDYTAWLEMIPFGVISRGYIQSTAGWGWNGLGGQPHYRIVMGMTANLVAGRGYTINWQAPPFEQTTSNGALTTSANIGGCFVRYSPPGGGVSANGSGYVLPGSLRYIPGGGTSFSPQGTSYVRCPEDIPAGKIMFGIEAYCYAGRSMVTASNVNANRWEIVVSDVGPSRPMNDSVPASSSQQGTEPTPPPLPPAPDPVREYQDVVPASWWQAYTGDNSQATHSTYAGKPAQGRTPYAAGNGVMRGLVGFPSQASRLSGANVKRVEVYVHADKWHASAGGTACIGTHGHGSKPGSWSSTSNDVKRQKMKRNDGRWITLPSSVHAGFKSGSLRGISLYPPGGSTSTEYYGLFFGNKTKLRITYEK